jgi:hypothetical protein
MFLQLKTLKTKLFGRMLRIPLHFFLLASSRLDESLLSFLNEIYARFFMTRLSSAGVCTRLCAGKKTTTNSTKKDNIEIDTEMHKWELVKLLLTNISKHVDKNPRHIFIQF